jgi:hypothetical protein
MRQMCAEVVDAVCHLLCLSSIRVNINISVSIGCIVALLNLAS